MAWLRPPGSSVLCFTLSMADQRRLNYFDRPTPSLRHSMPYVVELFNGADKVKIAVPGYDMTVEVFERGTIRLSGEIAAYDGVTVPLGLRADSEEWDLVIAAVKGDGTTGVGVCRRGTQPVHAIPGGELNVESGTICITTVEQVKKDGRLSHAEGRPWILPGSVSESVRIGNGTGDGGEAIIALLDDAGEMCGVFVGSIFESGAWAERILPGETVMSVKDLREALVDSADAGGSDSQMPIAVQNERGEFIGYVREWDYWNTLVLTVDSSARPDEAK